MNDRSFQLQPAHRAAPWVALGLLLVLGLWHWHRPSASDAEEYYAQVRQLAYDVPMQVDVWQGSEGEVPTEAVQLLRPNVLVSRTYRNASTGQEATLIIIHCKDARDMAGHYPPNCYPANGWQAGSTQPHDWRVREHTAGGMDYTYRIEHAGVTQNIRVANLIVLPDGRFVRDMHQLRRSVADYTRYFYGAGQVQFITNAQMPVEQRDALFEYMLEQNDALINTMLHGMQVVHESASTTSKFGERP